MHARKDAERRDLAGDDLGHHTLRFDDWMLITERLAANSSQVAPHAQLVGAGMRE